MTLTTRIDAGVAWLRLARPPVNALDRALVERIVDALGRCADDPAVRVVVLGAEGRHFCAGADLDEQRRAWREGGQGAADLGPALYAAMLGFPKPLVGMAHGAALGAGLSILACCDFAVAAEGTRIALPEIDVGVLGGVSHARAVLDKALAHYLALTGAQVAVETLRHTGLFVDVVPASELDTATARIARAIAAKDPEAARATKRCMRAVEGVGQLEGYVRECGVGQELRDAGVSDRLLGAFLDR